MLQRRIKLVSGDDRIKLTPMIDVVFLLLIYFMVTAAMMKKEEGFKMLLPAPAVGNPSFFMPEEYVIRVGADGVVFLDDAAVSMPGDRKMKNFMKDLIRLRQTAQRVPGGDIRVILDPDDEAKHQRVIDILNVCKGAAIKQILFASADGGVKPG